MSNVTLSSCQDTALVLAAHGSQNEPLAAYQTHAHVQRIREMGLFDEVRASFWKEAREWHMSLDGIRARRVIVVPMLMSAGYFSSTILPRSLALANRLHEDHQVFITEPVGTHPALLDAAHDTLLRALRDFTPPHPPPRILLAGHGTERHQHSGASLMELAEHLRAKLPCPHLLTVRFLDQEPRLAPLSAAELDEAPDTILLPYFIASGQHTLRDIPDALGLSRSPDVSPYGSHDIAPGKTLHYLEPLGAQPPVVDVILARASALLTRQTPTQATDTKRKNHKTHLLEHLTPHLHLSADASTQGWSLCARADADVGADALEVFDDHLALWKALRSRSSLYASLPTTLPVPTGWRLLAIDLDEMARAIDLLFPGLTPSSLATRATHTLSLRTLLEHLGGNQARSILDPRGPLRVDLAILEEMCQHGCMKHRIWSLDTDAPLQAISSTTTHTPSCPPHCQAPCAALLTRLARQNEPLDTPSTEDGKSA